MRMPPRHWLWILAVTAAPTALAQTPVDASGEAYPIVSSPEPPAGARIEDLSENDIPLLPAAELESLMKKTKHKQLRKVFTSLHQRMDVR